MNLFSCLKMPVDINTWHSNRVFWECYHGLINFLFDHMLQMHSIQHLTTNNNFILFTVHFYAKDLGMMAFLSLHMNSINIKGNFLNKFFIKCCTCPHVLMFFCQLSQPTSEHSKNVQKTFIFEHSENLQSQFSQGTPKNIQF